MAFLLFPLVVSLAIDVLPLEQSGFLGSYTVRISWNPCFLGWGGRLGVLTRILN